jgi:hypothetical protein
LKPCNIIQGYQLVIKKGEESLKTKGEMRRNENICINPDGEGELASESTTCRQALDGE